MITPNGETKIERKFLGVVEVDSGTLILGDPAYCLPDAERGKPGIDYELVVAAPDAVSSRLADMPVFLLSKFGGDGAFPVYAELDEDGYVERITIEFFVPADDE